MFRGCVGGSSYVVRPWFQPVLPPVVVSVVQVVPVVCAVRVGRVVIVVGAVGSMLVVSVAPPRHPYDKPEHFPLDAPKSDEHAFGEGPRGAPV